MDFYVGLQKEEKNVNTSQNMLQSDTKEALSNFYTKVAILLIPKRHEDLINKNFQANFWCKAVVYIISIIF